MTLKLPRQQWNKLTDEVAINIALNHEKVKKFINNKTVGNIKCKVYPDYKYIVHISTVVRT